MCVAGTVTASHKQLLSRGVSRDVLRVNTHAGFPRLTTEESLSVSLMDFMLITCSNDDNVWICNIIPNRIYLVK